MNVECMDLSCTRHKTPKLWLFHSLFFGGAAVTSCTIPHAKTCNVHKERHIYLNKYRVCLWMCMLSVYSHNIMFLKIHIQPQISRKIQCHHRQCSQRCSCTMSFCLYKYSFAYVCIVEKQLYVAVLASMAKLVNH